jgi:hypothetical protein
MQNNNTNRALTTPVYTSEQVRNVNIGKYIYRTPLPLLHKKEVHGEISQEDKSTAVHTQPYAILPQRLDVEAEGAKDGGAGNFNVETVFVVDEGEVLDFIDDEAFEGVVEDGKLQDC